MSTPYRIVGIPSLKAPSDIETYVGPAGNLYFLGTDIRAFVDTTPGGYLFLNSGPTALAERHRVAMLTKLGISLTGATKGDKGDTGAAGAAGTPGVQGRQGDKGDKGDTGAKGQQGEPGPQGARGETPDVSNFYNDNNAAAFNRQHTSSGGFVYDTESWSDDAKTTGNWAGLWTRGRTLIRETNTDAYTGPMAGTTHLRDGLLFQMRDFDTFNYSAQGHRGIMSGARFWLTGACVNGAYQTMYKDMHAVWACATADVEGPERGVSGLLASATQLGNGVATNELEASNPAGSRGQGAHLSAVIANCYNGVAESNDVTTIASGVTSTLFGKTCTAFFRAASLAVAAVGNGFAHYFLKGDEATVTVAAISMPKSAAGTQAGTIISYDPNDYTFYDRLNDAFAFIVGGKAVGVLHNNGWAVHSPAPTSETGALNDADCQGRFVRFGSTVTFTYRVNIRAKGTGGGAVKLVLPYAARGDNGTVQIVPGRVEGAGGTGVMLQGRIEGASIAILRYDNNTPIGDNTIVLVSGSYEAVSL